MADNIIAKASVALGADGEGFLRDLTGIAGEGGKTMGAAMKGAIETFALPAAALAVGAGLLDIGEKFQGAFNTIITKTGATGQALKGLEGDFKAVFSSTPGATFQNVAAAISEVYDRTKLVGAPLDELTSKFVELGKITGTDVATDVQSVTALLNNFGVSAADQSAELDVLYKASQLSGVALGDLTAQMQVAAPVAQTLGLNFNQTASLVAQLTEAGLPASRVMQGLASEFAKAAKAGEDPTTVIGNMVTAIKSAPTPTAAATLAIHDFGIGARQAAQLVDAVRSGALNFGATLGAITDGKGGIRDATEATMTLGDRFGLLKNQVLTAVEPIAAKVLGFADDVVAKLPGVADAVGGWFSSMVTAFDTGGLSGVITKVGGQVDRIGQNVWDTIGVWTPRITSKLGEWASAFANWVSDVWPKLQANLTQLALSVDDWVGKHLPDFGAWISASVDWIKATLPVAEQRFADWLTGLGQWFQDNAGPWMNKNFGKWGEALGKWLADNTPMLVLKFDVLVAAIGYYVLTKFIPELVKSIGLAMVTFSVQIGTGVAEGAIGAIQGISKGIGEAIAGIIKDGLNGAIGAINWFLAWMHNNLKIDIGGGSFMGVDLPELKIGFPDIQIPKLAAGTPDFSGGLALVGEQGPELAVLPRHTQVIPHSDVRRAIDAVQSAGAGGAQQPVFHVDNLIVPAMPPERLATDLVAELKAEAWLAGAA